MNSTTTIHHHTLANQASHRHHHNRHHSWSLSFTTLINTKKRRKRETRPTRTLRRNNHLARLPPRPFSLHTSIRARTLDYFRRDLCRRLRQYIPTTQHSSPSAKENPQNMYGKRLCYRPARPRRLTFFYLAKAQRKRLKKGGSWGDGTSGGGGWQRGSQTHSRVHLGVWPKRKAGNKKIKRCSAKPRDRRKGVQDNGITEQWHRPSKTLEKPKKKKRNSYDDNNSALTKGNGAHESAC
ncbi:hypothetical protein BDY21DRAFT_61324 [Lineolata rhizophorae]|uniref:Uncharacterized protein n=1 Tax=Lineolata rhizophorae TaxID=578093 RepID=A0A6A6NVR4_9PEZI|nr:hypothetical protein BDY21DRAFT_61324 [Lineolata rhizophorae]